MAQDYWITLNSDYNGWSIDGLPVTLHNAEGWCGIPSRGAIIYLSNAP